MKQRLRNIILIIKILLRVPGYEWFSPYIRERMNEDPSLIDPENVDCPWR